MKLRNKLFFLLLHLITFSTMLQAEGTQSFTKEIVGNLNRDIGETITFNLKSSCNSLNGDCGDLEIRDTLPIGLSIESCEVPTGFTATQCTKGESEVIINKDSVFEGGDSFSIKIKATITLDTGEGINITNSASASITLASDINNSSVSSDSGSLNTNNKINKWTVSKVRTSPSTSLKPTWDTDVSYKVEFCSNTAIGNVNLSSAMMRDEFPANAIVINNGGATENGNTLTWDLGDLDLLIFYGSTAYSSKKCISKNYTLRYPEASFSDGDSILNTVTGTGTPANGIADINEVATINETIGIPTPGAGLSKSANDVLPNSDMSWALSFNVDASNAPVPDLVIYETFPTIAGLEAKSVTSGQWNSPATTNEPIASMVKAKISSATDSAGDCKNANYTTDLSSGFIESPASVETYVLVSNTTCVKWEFKDDGADGPSIPRGWKITKKPIVIQTTTGYGGAVPIEVENCLDATFTNFDSSTGSTHKCATANIEEVTPEIQAIKTASSSSLKPGDTVQYTLRFRHDKADSTGPTINPIVTDLLPLEFDFISWDEVTGLNGENEPNLEKIEDYDGTGKLLLRFSWSDTAPINSVKLDGTTGVDNPASFSENRDVRIKFTVQVKAGTLANSYSNSMQFFDNSARQTCQGTISQDTNDLDGDGDTGEEICASTRAIVVVEAAVVGGSKWIKGIDALGFVDASNPSLAQNALCPNDNNYTRTPCVAQTLRGENFEYLFKLLNVGNKELKDYIFYDLLPYDGDTGTGEALSLTSRGSEWRPTVESLVTPSNANAISAMAQTGAIIEYSSASNPCRPEVSSSADESGWQDSCTDDWTNNPTDVTTITAFRIKLPFSDTTWKPIEELQFTLSMKAPYNAYLSKIENASKINPAWNSFSHRVTQASNDDRLLAAEPKRVGIVVPAGPPVSIGSAIWKDVNNNAIQEAGEELLNESTKLELLDFRGESLRDNDNVLVAPIITNNGKYFFDNLPEGNYSIVVTPPSIYRPSNGQNDADNNDTANDSNIKIGNGSYTSGTYSLTHNNEPTEVGGLAGTDDADDSDENSGNMSVDFGFYKPAVLGNFIWMDNNQNGLQDSEEPGVADINVTLYQNCTTEIESKVTLDDGKYQFFILEPGSYCVGFSNLPEGYFLTQNSADDTLNSDIDSSSNSEPHKTVSVELQGGDKNLNLDLGITAPIISGNIFDDGNGDGTLNGTAISALDTTALYALLCQGNTKLASKTISNGTYAFYGSDGVHIDSNYSVILSTSTTSCTPTLLDNWNNTDEKDDDDITDGKVNVTVERDNIEGVDFGINKQPLAQNVTAATTFNPGGNVQVDVPDLNVSDLEDGTPTTVTFKTLPNNATVYYNGTAVTAGQVESSFDNSLLTVNPDAGALTVNIIYTTTDKAGVISDDASIIMPFKDLKISGNLFIDGNGNGNIDGSKTSNADSTQLYVTLVDGGTAVASMPLSAGSYDFDIEDGLKANTSYTLVLSESNGSTTASLPTDWDNKDGENINSSSATGNDESKDGVLTVDVAEADVTLADFGINKKPEAEDVSEPTQTNPGNGTNVQVPDLNISDGQTTTGLTVTLTNIPSNGTLYYDGTVVTGDINISNFDNTLLTIDPQSGDQNVSFTYTTTDAAGTESDVATVSLEFTNITISGTLFNDGNGNGDVDGNVTNMADTTGLFVTLVDANGVKVASKALLSDGTYYFDSVDGLSPDSNYTVVLTDVLDKLTASLPINWNNADGENIGLVGLDGTTDGINIVNVLRADIPEINFGINKKPLAQDKTEDIQFNPGSSTQVNVPDLNITDNEDGVPRTITATQLPTNGTLYYNGVPVVLDANITDVNLSAFSIDPNDGDITSIFKYTTTDEANVSSEVATVTLPFAGLQILGNIFNDGNNDNTVNGTGVSEATGIQLYVTLIDENNTIVASHEVNADGTYGFVADDGLIANSDYQVILSTSENNVTANLPVNWSNLDGEHIGTDEGTDGSKDGMIDVALATSDVEEVNFGINKKPVASDTTEPLQLNPGNEEQVTVPNLIISDNEDSTPSTISIITLPVNGTLYYDGTAVTTGQTFNDFNNSLLTLDPNNGDVIVTFTYTTTDAVDVESDVATVSMSFEGLEIKGNIFNDGNHNGTVDGTKISEVKDSNNTNAILYATLLDDANKVMASIPISTDGSYGFDGADGIVPDTNYTVILSNEINATTPNLPSNWNNADGEHVGTNAGLDGLADGKIVVEVIQDDVLEVNFGINKRPLALGNTETNLVNLGSTSRILVPDLNVSDNEDGRPTTITITSLPTNGILYYDGVPVVAGVAIEDFNASKLEVDPNDGDLELVFVFTTRDRTGFTSIPATETLVFTALKIKGNIFNDGNDDSTINGTGISAPNGTQLYVTLVDENRTVVASHEVTTDGSYVFENQDNLVADTNYRVILSISENNTTAGLPLKWSNNDGENIGTNTGTDGNNDGLIIVPLKAIDIEEVNFGINKQPVAGDVTEPLQLNPGNATQVNVPNLIISDNEDNVTTTVTIRTIPSHGTLYYDGIAVTENQVITNFDNALLTIDPKNGDQTVSFTYTTTDAVGDESELATVVMSFEGLEIRGNIFNDGNNDTTVNGTKISAVKDSNNSNVILYATLLDDNNTVMASMPISTDGSYGFDGADGIIPDTNYTVILSTELNATTPNLPSNWNNADGEHIGVGVGLDGNADGKIAVAVVSIDVVQVNFGINKKPLAGDKTEALQFNPGSTTQATIPSLNISDLEDAVPPSITITQLPTNGTLYHNGVAVVLNETILNADPSKFTVDPNDGDLTVVFNYTTTDRVGITSNEAIVTLPFVGLEISGNIFNDGNDDNRINGTKISTPDSVQLYVTLFDVNQNTVVASHRVKADGSYIFNGADAIIANSQYQVILSVKENAVTASLPLNWSNNDGEHIGTNTGTDGTNDGLIEVAVSTSNVVEVNFGINKKPVASDTTGALQLNPGNEGQVTVPNLIISDNEDSTPSTITIVTLPVNGTLYYAGIAVSVNQEINNFDNALLTIDPKDGDQTVSFNYTTTDAVGDESEVATVVMRFDGLEIRGNIFDDGNHNGTVDGTKISTVEGIALYATLLDTNNSIIATTIIANDGSYKFTGVEGIVPNTNYNVILSTEMNATTPSLSSNWNNADGEHIGTDAGLDGLADGKIAVEVVENDVVEVNFGINEQPLAIDKTEILQLNPGSNTQVSVPTLAISDNEDGTPQTLIIKSLPTNGTLYYNGVEVVLNANILDANLSNFSVDPDNGDLNVTFTYTSTDSTGWESETATVVMPFDGLEIYGQVFVDANANNNVDGSALTDTYGLTLFANLVDDNGTIISTVALDSNGSYTFNASTGIIPNSNYMVVLSQDENSTLATLPSNWMHSDRDTNGTLAISVGTTNVTEVNFGLNQQPIVTNVTAVIVVNPDTNQTVVVPDLNISANEDGTTTATTVTLLDLPDNGTLYYDGTPVTEGQVINDFNSSLLVVDPDDANVNVVFNYTVTDDAGFESEEATVTIPFSDPDTDGDGITNSNDLDDDNDGILDTVENNTALNNGDTDGDGIPDRLDLDADGDGILDLEESNPNFETVDTNGDGVLDSTTDADNDGVMDSADADDSNPTSGGSVIPVDTDNDGQPDFQDVDSDNDGLSDLVEGGTDATLDANTDGMLDDQTDTDGDGIADAVDPDNGGTPASTPDTDNDGIDNYQDLDSDSDTLLDVIEIGGTDSNNDGQIEPVGTLISGINLPDENANGIPDILEIKLRDDNKTAPAGTVVSIDLLANDSGDVDKSSIELVIPTDFNATARLSADGKRMVVDGEGEWSVDENGILTFTPEDGFRGSPTPIMYKASNIDGTKSAVANVTITVTDVAGAGTEVCETYSEDSISLFGNIGLLMMLLLSTIFGVLLMRKER